MNDPVRSYDPNTEQGRRERSQLSRRIEELSSEVLEIPCIIGGKEVRTGRLREVRVPHRHGQVLARFHLAGPWELEAAKMSALQAKKDWERWDWMDRAAIFWKAGEVLSGPWRDTLNAATMLGQSKNVHQAEIDAACELIDFWKFNSYFYQELHREQPLSPPGTSNRSELRPLEGFVAAISPFNFTAIGANLASAPALAGNVVLWKPSDTQMLSAYYSYQLLLEAGLPPEVIQFVPAEGPDFGDFIVRQRELAGIHFTGSTQTFQKLWKGVAENLESYRSFPRLVGETGGKDFVFAHFSADQAALQAGLIRGAFEYQGQKCSAASRAYLPKSLWDRMKPQFLEEVRALKIGPTEDLCSFINSVIDERAFQKIQNYCDRAQMETGSKILIGGKGQSHEGYYFEPTVIETSDPRALTMREEIFGPVLTIYPYEDRLLEETLDLCDSTVDYALTGAIYSQDRKALIEISDRLLHAAGNLYLNDKCTGAIVGNQPFGGARKSGTNDKAGSPLNLQRWISPRTVKEVWVPVTQVSYPWQNESL
jgi:1-pyrroline-5-carboxylate dehydrogenase